MFAFSLQRQKAMNDGQLNGKIRNWPLAVVPVLAFNTVLYFQFDDHDTIAFVNTALVFAGLLFVQIHSLFRDS
jgi:hypothetical protein